MKKSFVVLLLTVAFVSVLLLSSCENRSGRRVREKAGISASKSDTLLFAPEKIGATKLVKEFIPYPKFDGGTGLKVSFSIGVEYKGKTYQVNVRGGQFFSGRVLQEEAESDPAISDLVLTHYLASNTPKDYVGVMVVNGEVIKIIRRPAFISNEFYPVEIIWEKK